MIADLILVSILLKTDSEYRLLILTGNIFGLNSYIDLERT